MNSVSSNSDDPIVQSLRRIDEDMSRQMGGIRDPNFVLVEDWVDSIQEELWRSEAVRQRILKNSFENAEDLYSTVGALQDSIDENVVTPYWDQICVEMKGYENFDQIFSGKNFTGEADRKYLRDLIDEARDDPTVIFGEDIELLEMAEEERYTVLDLSDTYEAAINVFRADEFERADVKSPSFTDYDRSGL